MNKRKLSKINREIERISDRVNHQRDKWMNKAMRKDKGNGYKNFHKYWCNFHKQVHIHKLLRQVTDREIQILNEIPPELMTFDTPDDYGDIFTVEEFKNHTECGGIMDSDGLAYIMYEGKKVFVSFCPSLMKEKELELSRYSGVAWYNK